MIGINTAVAGNAEGLVAIIGAVTAIFAATIGLAQTDIKKVLAYSTVSQLGYMFLAAGVGAYSAAIFHVMTHAFFKALLFLGSGSVIHAMGGEQDMRKMGGLKKHLPVDLLDVPVGTLAIAGHPAARRLLQQGRDPRTRRRRSGHWLLWRGPAHRGADGLLHVPRRLPDLPRRVPRHARAGAPPARVAAVDDAAARGCWRWARSSPAGSGIPSALDGRTSTGSTTSWSR